MLLPEEESGRSKSESHQVDYLSWTEELLVVVDMSAARTSRRCPGTVLKVNCCQQRFHFSSLPPCPFHSIVDREP